MTRTWQDNAEEYASLAREEGWAFGVLVACSVEKGEGEGRNDRYGLVTHGKVSATKFAKRAGTTAPRVLRYLTGWEKAAAAGVVPFASTLSPDDVRKIELPTAKFEDFYKSPVGKNVQEERKETIRGQAQKDGVGASKAIDIASNPKAMGTAIKADPKTRDAARQALADATLNDILGPPPPQAKGKQKKADRVIEIEQIAEDAIRDILVLLDPDLDDLGRRLSFLVGNIDSLSDTYRQRLARALIEHGGRTGVWEDRVRGLPSRLPS